MTYAKEIFLSSCCAKVPLLVSLKVPSQLSRNHGNGVPSQLPSNHGNGPSGWPRTDFMSSFLLVAMRTMWPNSLWSALRIASLVVPLATLGFTSENVFNFCLRRGSWNAFFLLSIRSTWKCLYAVSPTSLAVRRSLATSGGAVVAVDRLTRSVGSPLNGFIYSVPINSTTYWTATSSFRIRDDSKSWHQVAWYQSVLVVVSGKYFYTLLWYNSGSVRLAWGRILWFIRQLVSLLTGSSVVWSTGILPKGFCPLFCTENSPFIICS